MITALIRKTSASVIHFLWAEKTRFLNQEEMQSQFSHSLLLCSVENYSIQLTLCLFLFLVFQQMNRHRYTLSKTYRRCLSPVLPSQLHTTLPLLAEGSLLLRLIITCLTFGLFLWIPFRARSARWIFPGKNCVKLIFVAVNTTTSFPGFSPTARGRAGKNPGNEFVNIRLSALLSFCS